MIAITYAGFVAVLSVLQGSLIFPGAATQGKPEARFDAPPGCEVVSLKAASGETIKALFGPALTAAGRPRPDAHQRPTIVFFYGNAMCIAYATDLFARFRRLGANVLIPDYLGFGMSDGKPSEAGCYATADVCFDYLKTRKDIDPKRIVSCGWSIGGGVAIDLAARRSVAGLAVFSTFTSLTETVKTHMPFLPVRILLRHRFESDRKIAQVTCPILIGHGKQDPIIPFTMMDQLIKAAGGPVTRIEVPDAGHNDFFETGSQRVFGPLERFLNELP